jgi:endonuclease/exonuclease/phosphatase family metal-dependent hydrolase
MALSTRLVVAVCWLLASSGSLAAAESFELDVMSFNIRYGTARDGENSWPNRREMVFDLIRRERPDVIGLQEALRFQIDELLKALPEYESFGVGRDDGKSKGEHAAILYRKDRLRLAAGSTFWLSDTPEVVASTSWGNGITRICTWARLVDTRSELPLTVYNVHLDHRSQGSRERSVELLAQTIRSRRDVGPFVVLGDFNASEDNSAIRYLKGTISRASSDGPIVSSPGLVDTFRVLHPDAKEVGTFNGWRATSSRGKIDYVLAPPWIRVLEAKILRDRIDGRSPSDHFPVSARLVVPRVRES